MPWSMAAAPVRESTPAGRVTSRSAGTTLWVAYDPGTPVHATRSPTRTAVTPGPTRLDDTRPLEPERKRELALVEPGALVDVDEVHPGRLEADEGLALAGLGRGQVVEPHGLRTAVLVDADRSHQEPSSWCRLVSPGGDEEPGRRPAA